MFLDNGYILQSLSINDFSLFTLAHPEKTRHDVSNLPQATFISSIRMGYETEYERDLVFSIEDGVVKSRIEVDNKQKQPYLM